jgi:hypothetical protein
VNWELPLRHQRTRHGDRSCLSCLVSRESAVKSSGMNTSKISLPITPFGMNTSIKSRPLWPVFAPKVPAKSSAMNTSKNSPVTCFRMNTYRQTTPATSFRMNTCRKMGRGVPSACRFARLPSRIFLLDSSASSANRPGPGGNGDLPPQVRTRAPEASRHSRATCSSSSRMRSSFPKATSSRTPTAVTIASSGSAPVKVCQAK